jgi:hypothetical protein
VFAPAHGKEQQPGSISNVADDVYSCESFNPESSATMSLAHAEKIAPPAPMTSSPGNGRRNVHVVYDKEENERIVRGQKPFIIDCDSAGRPNENGRYGFRFLEVLRAFCVVNLDVSVIKVGDQNAEDYARLREEVKSIIECTGHPISDDGFKKSVSRCMIHEDGAPPSSQTVHGATFPRVPPQRATACVGKSKNVLELYGVWEGEEG